MSYDYGRKYIAKKTGLKGVEAGHIARQLEKQGLDYQSFDWETIGGDLYGHGKRKKGVEHHLKNMYGVSLSPLGNVKKVRVMEDEAKDLEEDFNRGLSREKNLSECQTIFNRRSPRSKFIDLRIDAKETFDPGDAKGVKKWKKYPNQYDIWGVDDIH